MALSGNGWPVSPSQSELGIETMVIGNASFPVRGGQVRQALEYVITQVHNRVEKANSTYGCWGYSYRMNVNSPGVWSNHASATAIDYNATLHPNGVPTSSTFTAAQIAEIHQILAEVGGVVRWGGDYNGTPDAMHFEIDVPPEALDVAIDENAIPINGEIKSIGAPSLEDPTKIPRLSENSVSYPTMMNYGHGFAQWLYTPTQTGTISIDALLSHFSDPKVEAENPLGPSLGLHIFEVAYDAAGAIVPKFGTEQTAAAWPGDDLHPARLAGQMNASVKAGVNYVIRATCIPTYPWIRAVVRIGSFPEVGPWITPEPIETITTMRANTSGGTTESLHFPIILDASQDGERWVYQMGHPGWFYTGLEAGPQFTGYFLMGKAVFGSAPWTDMGAVQCAWRWARRFDQRHGTDDRNTWSPDGTLTTGWNGTPVDSNYDWFNISGYGTCVLRTDVEIGDWHAEEPYSYFMGRVGTRYRIDTPLDSGWDGQAGGDSVLFEQFKFTSLEWQAYGGSYHVDFDRLRYSAGASGWGGAWRGPGFGGTFGVEGYRPMYMPDELDDMPGAWVEWEGGEAGFGGSYAKILDALWAVDEYHYGTAPLELPYSHNVSTVAEWYLQRVQPAEGVDGVRDSGGELVPTGPHPYGMWGPWGDLSWYGQAPGDGPQAFAGSAEHVASTTGGTTAWQSIDPSYWSFANDRDLTEDAWEDDAPERPAIPAQVRFAVLPRALFSDALPFTPPLHHGQQESGDDLIMEDFLQGQAVAIKLVLQPTRYRINYAPQIPDITYAGGPSIDLGPEDTGQVLY